MFLLYKLLFKILNLIIKIFTKTKLIPKYMNKKNYFNKKKFFIYILPNASIINLIILRQKCLMCHFQDPLKWITIRKKKILPTCIFLGNKNIKIFKKEKKFQKIKAKKFFKEYINTQKKNNKIDFKIILVSIMFGRIPIKEKYKSINTLKKIIHFIWYRKNIFINFSKPVSFKKIIKKKNRKNFFKKLIKIIKIYYIRKEIIIKGKKIAIKKTFYKKLIKNYILTILKIKENNYEKKSIKKINKIFKEISSNFSYEFIRITDFFLSIIFNYLYKKIKIKNIERIQEIALNKNKIIYIPSHRSHIDYLILSYVLYHNGLAPPYIAAGVNLNFFPLGIIFKNLGAFFIRRSFTAQKLYLFIFKKYFTELFQQVHSMEYFIEGKRSRTGKLSKPKTGILSLILEIMIKIKTENIVIVPVNINYDSILEIQSYQNELKGKKKNKENFLTFLKIFKKIKKSGNSYINFGKPLFLKRIFLKNTKNEKITNKNSFYINLIINTLSNKIMTEINNSIIVNEINLCSTALINSKNQILNKKSLIKQIKCYFYLIKNIRYSKNIVLPNIKNKELSEKILELKEFSFIKKNCEKFFIISKKYKNLISYYQNNILHLLIIPSLIIVIVTYKKKIKINEIYKIIKSIYPLIKIEFYINYCCNKITFIIDSYINELNRQNLIFLEKENIFINKKNKEITNNLSLILNSFLIRYAIICIICQNSTSITKKYYLNKTYLMAKKIYYLYDIKNIDFLDKETFLILINFFLMKNKSKKKIIFENITKIIPKNIYYFIENNKNKI